MDAEKTSDVQAAYDRVADEYVRRIYDELQHKPFDRQLLERFAAKLRDSGMVCDLGCGPGHVARYLHERGVSVCGIDLSPEMVERARQLNPGIEFRQGDMMALTVADGAWAGIVAFYSIIHIPRANVAGALREMSRVLQAGGLLLLAFHVGDEAIHLEEWLGYKVLLDTFLFPTAEVEAWLESAGFRIVETNERAPYQEVEYQSRRAYILAQKPNVEG